MNKVRLSDIAAAAGVSKVTASKVLNPSSGNNTKVSAATRERILNVASRLGYRVNIAASLLAGGRSRLLGVLIDAHTSPTEFQRVAYAEEAAGALGYRFMVGQCKADMENIRAYIDDFSGRGIDGVIIHSNSFPDMNREIVEYSKRIPHVLFYDRPLCDDGSCSYVNIDLAAGTRAVVDHLAAQGRRRIACFAPYERFRHGKYPSFLARERGYAEGMKAHGLAFDPAFAERYVFERRLPVPELIGLAKRFIREEKPDAILARNDDVAAVVLRAMLEMGMRCPDDIAVAGYDNVAFCQYLYPSLTTVDDRLAAVSEEAVRILAARIEDGGGEPVRRTFTPELVVRESTAGRRD
ncbi:MAG: LacI family DNA-binding transcriptional regulator [Lentisphaeria bacterium]|nr:LacI family DNA-binding transcriptional regulator [Lentisphaeria bacterium]